jgi:uncharacterized membrane protein YphA (DoxX/SURF4 family)
MTVALWIVNIVLAVVFLGTGTTKLSRAKDTLVKSGMDWADSFSDPTVKAIGAAEFLGALGLILPFALDILPVLTPVAAVCLALVMAGAVTTHLSRHETPLPPAALGVLAVVSAVLGFVTI